MLVSVVARSHVQSGRALPVPGGPGPSIGLVTQLRGARMPQLIAYRDVPKCPLASKRVHCVWCSQSSYSHWSCRKAVLKDSAPDGHE
jgi:hypothetical protein